MFTLAFRRLVPGGPSPHMERDLELDRVSPTLYIYHKLPADITTRVNKNRRKHRHAADWTIMLGKLTSSTTRAKREHIFVARKNVDLIYCTMRSTSPRYSNILLNDQDGFGNPFFVLAKPL